MLDVGEHAVEKAKSSGVRTPLPRRRRQTTRGIRDMSPGRLVLAVVAVTIASGLTCPDAVAAAPSPACGLDYCVGDDMTLPGEPGSLPLPSGDDGEPATTSRRLLVSRAFPRRR